MKHHLQQLSGSVGLANSPLLPSSSLPIRNAMWNPGFDAFKPNLGVNQGNGNTYREFSEIKMPYIYPSIIVNGMIKDVNEIIKQIVMNKSFHPQFEDTDKASYLDPQSRVPILCPGRGMNCRHFQCFDIAEFLILQTDNQSWTCPICGAPLTLETIYYDPLFLSPRKNSSFGGLEFNQNENDYLDMDSGFNDDLKTFFDDFGGPMG